MAPYLARSGLAARLLSSALLLALLARGCGIAVCPVRAAQVLPFIPDAAALQSACKTAASASAAVKASCNLPCLCVFGQTLMAAAASVGKSVSGVDKEVLQACAIDSLEPLYERGLSTSDILRVSYCSFNATTKPACLAAPAPAPAPARSAADGVEAGLEDVVTRAPPAAAKAHRGAYVAVVVAACGAALLLVAALLAIALFEEHGGSGVDHAASLTSSSPATGTLSELRFRDVCASARAPAPRRGRALLARLLRRPAPAAPPPPRRVLRGVSLSLRRGELLAVLGPSGCGKSTLLSAMAGELALGPPGGKGVACGALSLWGAVSLDGRPAGAGAAAALRRACGFVAQDDVLPPLLSVREAVAFSAALRLAGPAWPPARRDAAVDAALRLLGLEHVASSRVGGANAARGVSGGERRRVSIAQELVIDPPFLLLDEPTSGLDSHAALSLVKALAALAADGRGVAAAVHAPAAEAFSAFSHALLLGGGAVLWRGAPGVVAQSMAPLGFSLPPGANAADFLLDLASAPAAAQQLADADAAAFAVAPPPSPRRSEAVAAVAAEPAGASRAAQPQRAGVAAELRALARRELACHARSPSLVATHIAAALLLALWLGVIYLHLSPDLAGFQNRAGAAFFTLTAFGFSALSALDIFVSDRLLLAKECPRYFRPASYYAVKAAVDALLLRALPALLYASIFYWLSGWQPLAGKFAVFVLGVVLTSLAAAALAALLAAASSSVGVGAVALAFILLQMCVFGGFLANTAALPRAVAWLRYLSLFNYGFEALLASELDGLSIDVHLSGFASVRGVDGASFLATLDQRPGRVPLDLAALAALAAALHAAAAAALTARAAPPGGYALLRRLRRSRGTARTDGPKAGDAEMVATRRGGGAHHARSGSQVALVAVAVDAAEEGPPA